MKADIIALAQRFLEHAPPATPAKATDLLGWAGAYRVFICEQCAGRIIARGCDMKRIASVPVWKGANPPPPPCDICHNGKRETTD